MTLAESGISFDGADQGLLNQYYASRPWKRLSFTYNCTPSAEYQWEPAYRYHKSSIKAVHFIGKDKPWRTGRLSIRGESTYSEMVGKWWSVHDRHYRHVPEYAPGKPFARSTAVQQRVQGEVVDAYYGVPADQRLPPPPITEIPPSFTPEPQVAPSAHVRVPSVSVSSPPSQETPSQRQPPPPPEEPTRTAVVTQPTPHGAPPPPSGESSRKPEPFHPPTMEWDATRYVNWDALVSYAQIVLLDSHPLHNPNPKHLVSQQSNTLLNARNNRSRPLKNTLLHRKICGIASLSTSQNPKNLHNLFFLGNDVLIVRLPLVPLPKVCLEARNKHQHLQPRQRHGLRVLAAWISTSRR